MKQPHISTAQIEFNIHGTPTSSDFDDVYFSNHTGIEESQYVFIQQNQLIEQWNLNIHSSFVIAETGFGTGLNFLLTWQTFNDQKHINGNKPERLHFVSFEKFPIDLENLKKAHQAWPELSSFAKKLHQQYPLPIPGCHRLIFDEGKVILDLWLGDIQLTLPQVYAPAEGIVDTWYLDGFAPSKNPDMWCPIVFNQIARLAKQNCRLATFTAAGFVRRGLMDAGFNIQKVKGFGTKREMLIGTFIGGETKIERPWFYRPNARDSDDVAIIGGGIASACLALSLIDKGKQVTLYCQDATPAQGASGNNQGAVYPLLSAGEDALTDFFAPAFTFARHFIERHGADLVFDHEWCGVTHLAWDEKTAQKFEKMLSAQLPESFVKRISIEEAEALTQIPLDLDGIFYALGGWLCPHQLTKALISKAEQTGKLICHFNTKIEQIHANNDTWRLKKANGEMVKHDILVLANGHQFIDFTQTAPIPAYPVKGQVSHIQTTPTLKQLKTVLCYQGYLTPVNHKTDTHCIGASYRRNETDLSFHQSDQVENKEKLTRSISKSWAEEVDLDHQEARVGIRTASRDHFPFVGNVCRYEDVLSTYQDIHLHPENAEMIPVYNNLFCLLALGSRGLTSAPLAAECLASQICGDPLPLSRHVLDALHPGRFWLRKLLKGKPVQPMKR